MFAEQLHLGTCVGDERNVQTQDQFRDIERQLQNVMTATGRIDTDAEKFRKETGVLSLKADTAFKKAKAIEDKVVRLDERVSKVQAETVLMKQTMCSTFGDNEIFPLEINDNFDEGGE